MNAMSESSELKDDPFDLNRFVSAQVQTFDLALGEIKQGRKRSHWMWFIFPQLRGLGRSSTAQRYGISNAGEATAYLGHELLGPRLMSISDALLEVENRTAREIFGTPDDMKLRSCATLFLQVAGDNRDVFQHVIDRYCDGKLDRKTLKLLGCD